MPMQEMACKIIANANAQTWLPHSHFQHALATSQIIKNIPNMKIVQTQSPQVKQLCFLNAVSFENAINKIIYMFRSMSYF